MLERILRVDESIRICPRISRGGLHTVPAVLHAARPDPHHELGESLPRFRGLISGGRGRGPRIWLGGVVHSEFCRLTLDGLLSEIPPRVPSLAKVPPGGP